MTYTDASQTYLENLASIFEDAIKSPLNASSDALHVPLSSDDEFESCLAEVAEWVHRNPSSL